MISMKNYGKKHSQPLLIIHINTKVPLGTLLFPDKPVYLWFSSWHKRCSIQRRLLRSPHVHQQHELFLPPALLLSSQRRLSQLQKQIGNVHTGREDKQTVGCSSDLVSSCKHKMSEQRLHWNFHLQNARKKKKKKPPLMILGTSGGFYQLFPSGQQSQFVTSLVFSHLRATKIRQDDR